MECFTADFLRFFNKCFKSWLLGTRLGTCQAFQKLSSNFLKSFGNSYNHFLVIIIWFCFTCGEKKLRKNVKKSPNICPRLQGPTSESHLRVSPQYPTPGSQRRVLPQGLTLESHPRVLIYSPILGSQPRASLWGQTLGSHFRFFGPTFLVFPEIVSFLVDTIVFANY